MKTKFTLLVLALGMLFSANAQQLPNASFDSWTTDTLAPDGWSTYESVFGMPLGHAMKDAVDKVVGPYSLKLVSDSIPGFASYGVLAGVCGLGDAVNGLQGPSFPGVSFTYRPDSLFVVYKYTSPGADTPLIVMRLSSHDTAVLGHPVYGVALGFPPDSDWVTGFAPLTSFYSSPNTPDTLSLQFYSSLDPSPNGGIQGSVLHLDRVLFGYVNLPNALQEVADKLNISVYPNPVAESLNISAEDNLDNFRLMVNDLSGKLISVNMLSGRSNAINVSQLPNGIYTYRLADKAGNILKQDRFNVVK